MLARTEGMKASWAYSRPPVIKDRSSAILHNNVQFIYELALAELELSALGFDYTISNGHRDFRLEKPSRERVLEACRRAAYFRSIAGVECDYYRIVQHNRTRSVNQYLTHWIYPYKGKFHPQMIRAILNIIGLKSGDTVLDPFIGSGTTAVEAELLGINCIGVDISPLCVLQSRVKTQAYTLVEEVRTTMDRFLDDTSGNLFTHDPVNPSQLLNRYQGNLHDFYQLALLIATSDTVRRHRLPFASLSSNLRQMSLSAQDFRTVTEELGLRLGYVQIYEGDARDLRNTTGLADHSVDGIVTSPPYSIALDYVENDKHALSAMGVDIQAAREKFIGVRGVGKDRVRLYDADLAQCIREMARVLKQGRYAVIVIGNATFQGREVPTVEFTIEQASACGLRLERNIDKIIFGLYNVMRQENILFFKKEAI